MEGRIGCVIRVELTEPICFEVDRVDQHHACVRVERAIGEQVFDLLLCLVVDPIIDLLADALVLLDEIRQLDSRAIVGCDQIKKLLQEWIRLFRPDRVRDFDSPRVARS